jgi:hypothetical protein
MANRPRARHRQDGTLDRQGNESMDQLDRIEAKLDALLAALAEDEPEQEQQFDLDGNEIEQGEDNGGAL